MPIKRIFLEKVTSTNDYAMEYIAKNAPTTGTVISTYQQTHGRGQIGTKWDSGDHKNLTFSLILASHLPVDKQFDISILVATTIAEILEERLETEVYIKWPNDIIVNDKKIGGILIQCVLKGQTIKAVICGIGINVHMKEMQKSNYTCTSMSAIKGERYDLAKLEYKIAFKIVENYQSLLQGSYSSLRKEYLCRMYRRGDISVFKTPEGELFEAEIIGINPIGQLCLSQSGTIYYYNRGEVKMRY